MDETSKFKCPHCKKVKSNMTNLRRHILRQHKKYIFGMTCYDNPRCKPNTFPSEELMNEHMTEEHKYKKCNINGCTKVFAFERNRGSHVSSVHSPKKRCPYCTKMYPTEEFENHRQSCTAKNMEPIKCDHCEKTFAKVSSLKKHQYVHNQELNLLHSRYDTTKCPHCPQRFARKYMILKHVQSEHPNGWKKDYICDHCNMRFDTPKEVSRHLTTLLKNVQNENMDLKNRLVKLEAKNKELEKRITEEPTKNESELENTDAIESDSGSSNAITNESDDQDNELVRTQDDSQSMGLRDAIHVLNNIEKLAILRDFDTIEKKYIKKSHKKGLKNQFQPNKHTCNFCGKHFTMRIALKKHLENGHDKALVENFL